MRYPAEVMSEQMFEGYADILKAFRKAKGYNITYQALLTRRI